jgi:DNA-binding CsgD family transcriptional regulator
MKADDPKLILLTQRERQLLELLTAGATNAAIATRHERSEKTVRNQLTRVYAKLGVVNRAQAVGVYLGLRLKAGQ